MVDSSEDSSRHDPGILPTFCMHRKLRMLYHLSVESFTLNSAKLTSAQPCSANTFKYCAILDNIFIKTHDDILARSKNADDIHLQRFGVQLV